MDLGIDDKVFLVTADNADPVRRNGTYPRRAPGRPRTASAIRELVLEMARGNPS